MPRRPRAHQLEDRSKREFERLLPEPWVVREKSHDYGVDLEVEIFAGDDTATGLIFNVQLKATDDPGRCDKLRLEVDKLAYYRSLGLPTLVARYCSHDNRFRVRWHFNLPDPDAIAGQTTMTYTFGPADQWGADSPAAIEQTLRAIRALDRFRPGRRMPVKAIGIGLNANEGFAFESAIHDVVADVADVLKTTKNGDDEIELLIELTPERLVLSIDCLSSLTFEIQAVDRSEITTLTIYAAAALLHQHGLSVQGERMARAALARGQAARPGFIAFEACRALASNLVKAVDLAILNGLHSQQSEFYAPFVVNVLTLPQPDDERDIAVERFYGAARTAARAVDSVSEAAVCYSLANYHRSRLRFHEALRYYNRARKLRPQYCRDDYFLTELGNCLFSCNRYRAAARAYRARMELGGGDGHDRLFLADALLFAGLAGLAVDEFSATAETSCQNGLLWQEAELKGHVGHWLVDLAGSRELPVRRSEAMDMMGGELGTSQLDAIITRVDSVNELAHFNLGVHHSRAKNHERALNHFLLCAFKQSGDFEAWANAVICATNLHDVEIIVGVMACAISLRGRPAYELLRSKLTEQNATLEALEMFDSIARDLVAMRKTHRTIR